MLKRTFKILLLFLLFFLTAGICSYFAVTFVIKSEDTVIVPDLTGKDIIYSLEILSSLNLNTKVTGTNYSNNIPKNHVILQEPEPGSIIKINRDVRIILSKGTQTVPVPNLENLSIQQAQIILEENGLTTGFFSKTTNSTVNKDFIISQSPLSGIIIERGTKINLLVSTGKFREQFMMMNLSGLSLDEAIISIESCGLKTGKIKINYKKNIPLNVICEQTPAAGFPVKEKSVIDLVINRKSDNKNQYLFNIKGVKLFRYKVANGFLNQHIRIQMNCFGMNINLYNKFMKPGEELWSIIPKNTDVSIFVYENNKLVKTEIFTM
ncbi:MAG: hypothetical protein B6I31_04365 [Desulfobacteraceae bacterium 4572_19]|nr:MAG: hypothetical protein B6I31_04365 [Desulfobacteraceae bacterium 4572_19]